MRTVVIYLEVYDEDRCTIEIKLYNKQNYLNFLIVKITFICRNILAAPVNSLYISINNIYQDL